MFDTLSSPRHLPDIDRTKAITFTGGIYKGKSDSDVAKPPHVLGIYTYSNLEGYKGGGLVFSRRDDLTIYQNGKVRHDIGWFAVDTQNKAVPLMDKRYTREGMIDMFNPKNDSQRITYIPSNDIAKIVPPTEVIGDQVVFMGPKIKHVKEREFMVESEVADSDYYPLSQISTLWHGARLFISKDNSAVLEVGEFTTTEEGKHISHKGTKEYEGSA